MPTPRAARPPEPASTRITHRPGDIVAARGAHYPKGVVQSQQPGNHVVVAWPDSTWTRQHATTLRRAA